uniref:Uncharacterized protein n=1 Tax=Anopheles darlingi TaxID=43151 RepID=A0A2M4DDQ5_ANODA
MCGLLLTLTSTFSSPFGSTSSLTYLVTKIVVVLMMPIFKPINQNLVKLPLILMVLDLGCRFAGSNCPHVGMLACGMCIFVPPTMFYATVINIFVIIFCIFYHTFVSSNEANEV